jgi:hypothetical protein
LHPAEELAPNLLAGEPAAAARVGDDEVERGPVVRRSPGELRWVGPGRQERLPDARFRGRRRVPRLADDLHVAAPPTVEAEVALALVERPESRVLAEEAHRR